MISNMRDLFNITNSNNADIIYAGAIWHESIEELSAILRRKMDTDNLPKRDCNAYFSIFVEMMSNMLKYSAAKTDSGVMKGSFILSYENGTYYAQCGNLMKTENKDTLKNRIDSLISMDKPALRKLYMKKLKEKSDIYKTDSAGLGLIEIAKCSSLPVEYEFSDFNDSGENSGMTLFTMRAAVTINS